MPAPSYSESELHEAVEALSDSARFHEAEGMVAAAAPGLQRILAEALASGGWFEDSHQAAVLEVAGKPEGEERLEALRLLLAEENRISMMIGVAVGWALSEELKTDKQED